MTAGEPVIEVRGLCKAFDGREVFDGLDLTVFRGETLTILGGSGSGKSVLLKLIIGLLEADRGEIRVFGQDLVALSEDERLPLRARIAMLFQGGALSQTVRERLELVFTEDLARDVGRTAHAAAAVAERLQNGPGLAHTLIYDPALAADARSLVNKTDRLVDRVDRVLVQVEKGPGTLHDLVYRDQGTRLVAELARAAEETRQVIGEIRTGKGLLHTLIYEEDKGNLLDNLTALSRTLRKIGDEVAEGKGTVGALLKDPSVYEDLKTILGNIRRSRFLRSLVRFTIKRQDLKAE